MDTKGGPFKLSMLDTHDGHERGRSFQLNMLDTHNVLEGEAHFS